ncbi:MAG TPA: hypothetical protein DIS79_07970 [Bacteroidetes bacterium]|nr:hypothetical protein [Bacteroidota bacterium]HRK04067.1 ASCH domain-containing protein [Chlorobiota bacterium]
MKGSSDSNVIHVLSIRQPWASMIVRGLKDVENRTWYTSFRGDFYVHAGKASISNLDRTCASRILKDTYRMTDKQLEHLFDEASLLRGGIIGSCRLENVVRNSQSVWALPEQYHFQLGNGRETLFIPCQGRLGFFRLDLSIQDLRWLTPSPCQ